MPDAKPVVSSGKRGSASENAAWGRVVRVMTIALTLVLAAGLYVDGGYAPGAAVGLALVAGIILHTILGGIGSARGIGFIAALGDRRNRTRLAAVLGLFCGALGAGGVYFHDGGGVRDAALTGGALAVVGFLAVYFPILAAVLGLLNSSR